MGITDKLTVVIPIELTMDTSNELINAYPNELTVGIRNTLTMGTSNELRVINPQ